MPERICWGPLSKALAVTVGGSVAAVSASKVNKENAYFYFEPAIKAFIAAFRKITADPPSRVQKLISKLMTDAGIPLSEAHHDKEALSDSPR